ncbi:MAG: Holliday junction resolvase RuvX [Actinomycetes bacterium]
MLRTGRRLAIDVGQSRIGLAVSDLHGILASPLATIQASEDLSIAITEIQQVAQRDGEILEIYIGIPVNLSGKSTPSTELALLFADEFAATTTTPVLLLDERLTTSLANAQLKIIGKSQKDARSTIDQMAAVAILEYALAMEKHSGQRPGIEIADWRRANE